MNTTTAATPPVDLPAPPVSRPTWGHLLRRSREVTKAELVLAIDDQGLVIGSDGSFSAASLEDVAVHVSRSFDFFESLTVLGKKVETVCARFVPEGTWLTAIRMRPPEGRRITLALVGPYTLDKDDRRRIRDAFERIFE